jgi:SAM-dependent methyltransferase
MLTRLRYFLVRVFFKTIGQSSTGIRYCFEYGLTSGKTLDYIYNNRPSGNFLIGSMIDKAFLNDPAWEAVRQRRSHLESLMSQSIASLKQTQKKISILDIASGPASYVLSVIQQVGEDNLFARCRDFDPRWVEEGKKAAQGMNLQAVHFEQGDAFDAAEILSLRPQPNLAIASGFYDWFSEDKPVMDSMKILYDALSPGGYFILSIQGNHPKLELTEAVFLDFNHEPLKMKMRSKETISSWLETIGFQINESISDAHEYYTVIQAYKPLTLEV